MHRGAVRSFTAGKPRRKERAVVHSEGACSAADCHSHLGQGNFLFSFLPDYYWRVHSERVCEGTQHGRTASRWCLEKKGTLRLAVQNHQPLTLRFFSEFPFISTARTCTYQWVPCLFTGMQSLRQEKKDHAKLCAVRWIDSSQLGYFYFFGTFV